MRLHATVAFLAALALDGLAAEAPRDTGPILEPILAKHGLPAMAGVVVTAEGLEAAGAVGVRERGRPEKATVDDLWHLGSCTKSMTATLCAKLVEERKLSFDTKAVDVLRDVKDVEAGWRAVTLRQLLTNHAGAPAGLDADGLWQRLWNHRGTPREQRRELVEGVLKRAPEAEPGTRYIYSNAGFSIAGAMAETVTDEPWETLIGKRLFEPLGMKSAGFGAPGTKDRHDQPRGHRANGEPVQPGRDADNPAAIGPAGTVRCTIGDWAKFARLHLVGERKGGTTLLAPESFVTLHTPSADESHYAMGWIVLQREWAGPGGRVLLHSGSNTMWYCVVWIAPEAGFAVLVTCNQGGDEAATACDEASWALIQDHLAHAKTPPK